MAVRVKKYILAAGLILLSSMGGSLFAQKNMDTRPEEFRGLDRWAFKTNALGWVATVPNFALEFDLSPSYYSHWTLGLGLQYNWETYQNIPSYTDFNLLTVRPELRYYWGAKELNMSRDTDYKGTYYLGVYVSGGTYTMKLSEVGRQGYHTGVGLSFGYAMPLYLYNKGAVDIEFGFYLGWEAGTADAFILNNVSGTYDKVPELSKGFGVLPYPIVTDLSITFTWRKTSIKHRHVTRYEDIR